MTTELAKKRPLCDSYDSNQNWSWRLLRWKIAFYLWVLPEESLNHLVELHDAILGAPVAKNDWKKHFIKSFLVSSSRVACYSNKQARTPRRHLGWSVHQRPGFETNDSSKQLLLKWQIFEINISKHNEKSAKNHGQERVNMKNLMSRDIRFWHFNVKSRVGANVWLGLGLTF